jgi:protein gp37
MGEVSKIQWTQATWNPAVGCTKVDADCKFCYMYRQSLNGTRYEPKTVSRTKPPTFNMPLRLKEPTLIFTASLTDIFHEDLDGYRSEIWDIIRRCPQHIFQILTKRPERIKEHLPEDWGYGWDNVWMGTSVGHPDSFNRAQILMNDFEAKVKFLSLEPLYGRIDFAEERNMLAALDTHFIILPGFDWVIVGGESGNDNGKYRYRPCELEWIETIVRQCKDADVPVFVKQLGTHLAKQLKLKDRQGGNMDEWPESLAHLKVRQMPKYSLLASII